MDFKQIHLIIVCCLVAAAFSGCDPGGDYIPTGAEVNLSVTLPGYNASSGERLITNTTLDHTLLVAVVSSNYGGGAYDIRTRGLGDFTVGDRGLTDDPPDEGIWREYSENGVTYGVAFLRVHIPQNNAAALEVQGTLCNMPMGEELIFMLALNKDTVTNFDESFGAVLNAIDDETTGLNIGRGYRITSLTSGQASLALSIIPTTAAGVLSAETDLEAVAGSFVSDFTGDYIMNIYTCTGVPGTTYLVRLVPGIPDTCHLYLFDSYGRPVGSNPQQGNDAELYITTMEYPDYPWADVAQSQYFLGVFGNHTLGSAGFDKYVDKL